MKFFPSGLTVVLSKSKTVQQNPNASHEKLHFGLRIRAVQGTPQTLHVITVALESLSAMENKFLLLKTSFT